MSTVATAWARAVVFALIGFALFGALVLGVLAAGALALPGIAAVAAAGALAWWLVRRGRRAVAVAVALVAQAVPAGALYVTTEIEGRRVCDTAERRTLEALRHVNGARPEVGGDVDRNGCVVRYGAGVDAASAVAHYRGTLTAGGWRVVQNRRFRGGTGELVARRGPLRVYVFWSDEGSTTRLAVTVAG